MTLGTIGFIGLGFVVLLLLARVPVGLVLGIVGFFGYAYIRGFEIAIYNLMMEPRAAFSGSTLCLVPLFVFMGVLCFHSGIGSDIYNTGYKWIGQLRGGLAMATVGGSALFSAVSGTASAVAASMAKVALPEMKKYNYDPGLACGSIAAGSTMGNLIPPSVILVVYALMVQHSVIKLLIAGILPGISEALFYMVTIYIVCTINPNLGPKGPKFSLREKVVSLRYVWPILVLFTLVMGGMIVGIFTPTEAGGIGAFGAFAIVLAMRRLTWQALKDSLVESTRITAMILFIVFGSMVFTHFIAVTRLPWEIIALFEGLEWNRYAVLAVMIALYLGLGCVMNGLPIVILTVPLFAPLVSSLGFSLIWFGIIVVRLFEIGGITPPVGMNVIILKGMAGTDVPASTIFKGVFPFFIADIVNVALLVAFPMIVLFLPSLLKY
ncbi:TRAP transporter large permease [Chloroflexota bacterium]